MHDHQRTVGNVESRRWEETHANTERTFKDMPNREKPEIKLKSSYTMPPAKAEADHKSDSGVNFYEI